VTTKAANSVAGCRKTVDRDECCFGKTYGWESSNSRTSVWKFRPRNNASVKFEATTYSPLMRAK
jgi:hypothetical protein